MKTALKCAGEYGHLGAAALAKVQQNISHYTYNPSPPTMPLKAGGTRCHSAFPVS